MMTYLAKEFPNLAVGYTNTNEFGTAIEQMFGLEKLGQAQEHPIVVIQKKAGDAKKWIYRPKTPLSMKEAQKALVEQLKEDGCEEDDARAQSKTAIADVFEESKIAMKTYLEKILNGEIPSDLKTEAVPDEDLQKQRVVKEVVSTTMKEMVFQATRDTFFCVTAPWCEHCKSMAPEFDKIGKKVARDNYEDILHICRMDGTLNDSSCDSIEWEGFPTLYYVKAGSETVVKYDGPRTLKAMWRWIRKNHSRKEVIQQKINAKKAGYRGNDTAAVEEPQGDAAEEEQQVEAAVGEEQGEVEESKRAEL